MLRNSRAGTSTTVSWRSDKPSNPQLEHRYSPDRTGYGTFALAEDSKLGIAKKTTKRLRFLVTNTGALTLAATSCRWRRPPPAPRAPTREAAAGPIGHGGLELPDRRGQTANIASGLTDPGGTSFIGGQVKESADTTGTLNIGTIEFVEVEYSIQATTKRPPAGTTASGSTTPCSRARSAPTRTTLRRRCWG